MHKTLPPFIQDKGPNPYQALPPKYMSSAARRGGSGFQVSLIKEMSLAIKREEAV